MQIDVTKLTPEAHEALVECLKIAARHGRLLREARECKQAAVCAGSLQINSANETVERLSPEDQLQQMNDGKQSRCIPASGNTMIDRVIAGSQAIHS